MKKYIFLVITIISTVLCGYSKEGNLKEQKIAENPMNFGQFIKSNWFVSAGGGVEWKFGSVYGTNLSTTPVIDLSVGKWLLPYTALRFQYNYSAVKGDIDSAKGVINTFADGSGNLSGKRSVYHMDVMFSLMNIIDGYYDDNRFYDLKPYFGLGFVSCYDDESSYTKDNPVFGVVNSFKLNSSLALDLELRASPANAGHYGMTTGDYQRDRVYPVSISVGLTYRFKPRAWRVTAPYADYPELRVFEKNAYIPAQKEIVIQKEIVTVRDTVSVDRVVKEDRIAPAIIFFEVDKYNITKRNRVRLSHVADVINNIKSDQVFTITGYADAQTATKDYNLKLSKNRAEAIYYALINEFKVDKRKLKIDYKGGVDYMYYDDNTLSRCVIIN